VHNLDPGSPESIHMCDWPVPEDALVDTGLEKQMDTIRNMVEATSNARQRLSVSSGGRCAKLNYPPKMSR